MKTGRGRNTKSQRGSFRGKDERNFFLFRGYRPLYPRESKHRACLKTTQTLPEVALAFRSRPRCVSQLWVFPGRSCRVFGTVAPATWGAERGCRRGQGRDASLNSECGGHWFHRVFTSPPRGTDSSGGSKGCVLDSVWERASYPTHLRAYTGSFKTMCSRCHHEHAVLHSNYVTQGPVGRQGAGPGDTPSRKDDVRLVNWTIQLPVTLESPDLMRLLVKGM